MHMNVCLRFLAMTARSGFSTRVKGWAGGVCLVVLAAAPWSSARATVLFNNIGLPRTAISGGISISGAPYGSFSTGSQAAVLNSLELELTSQNPLDGGSVRFALYSNSGSGPTGRPTLLGSVADSALSSSVGVYSVSVSANLAANTRYWIGLAQSGGVAGNDLWNYVSSSAGTGVSTEYDYYTLNSPALSPNTMAQAVYLMGVSASTVPVPEPSPLLWMIAPLTVLGLVQARRRLAS